MRAPEGTLISFATQPGSVALDGEGGDSPFSKALAVTMRQRGLELFQTFNKVGKAVLRETKGQTAALDINVADCWFILFYAQEVKVSSPGSLARHAFQRRNNTWRSRTRKRSWDCS